MQVTHIQLHCPPSTEYFAHSIKVESNSWQNKEGGILGSYLPFFGPLWDLPQDVRGKEKNRERNFDSQMSFILCITQS